MSILSKNKHIQKGYKLVGANMPSQVSNYLALYSLAKNTNKSKVISDRIQQWMSEEKKNYSIPTLLDMIVQRLRYQFVAQKKTTNPLSLPDYKKEVKTALINKGLDNDQINYILKSIKE